MSHGHNFSENVTPASRDAELFDNHIVRNYFHCAGVIPFLLMLLEIAEMFEAQVLIFIAMQDFTLLL
jgi:hypothetical protein